MTGSSGLATQQMMRGLTREQKDRCLEVIRRGGPRPRGGDRKNPGWWLLREPSVGNPPWLVIMRLRGADGVVLLEEVVTDERGKAHLFVNRARCVCGETT